MKKILSLMLILVSAFILVGCKKSKVSSNYEVKSIAELKSQKSVDVKFRIPFGSAIQTVINELIESFNEEYPNVNVTLDYIGGYDEMKKTTIYDINGGETPTMIVGYPDHFAEYLISDSIISLDKFINAEDSVIGYSKEELDDFNPDYIAENRQFDKDKTYKALPFNKSTEVMFYNQDFFDHFELTVPKTWAELEALALVINEKVAGLEDKTFAWLPKIATHIKNKEFMPLMYDSGGNLFTTIIRQYDGKYTESVYRDNGVMDLQRGLLRFTEDANAKTAFTDLQKLSKANVMNLPTVWEGDYGSNFFTAGQILMNVGSTAGVSHYSTSKSAIGVAPIPYKDADHKYVIQQGTNVAIFSQASDMEKLAAWLFIKHCLTPENTAIFATGTGYLPVRSSAYDTKEYKDFIAGDKGLVSKVYAAAEQYEEGWHLFTDAAWSGSSAVREEVELAAVHILVNGVDVKKAFDDAKSRYGK